MMTDGGGILRVRVARTSTRFVELMHTARYSLNSSNDNAVSEALALAMCLPEGEVMPERDLLRIHGFNNNHAPGTPDGAIILLSGGMHAVQALAPRLLQRALDGENKWGGAPFPFF